MPKLMTTSDTEVIAVTGPGTFQFSAMRIENLGATEYTLATIVCDISSSVIPFAPVLLKTIKSIISACQKSPRAENLLLRLVTFNSEIIEVHGFVDLKDINVDEYDELQPSGMTALFDASYDAIGATSEYSKRLVDQDFDCNGITFVITDGWDNRSSMTPVAIREKQEQAIQKEWIESHITVLVTLHDPNTPYGNDVERALDRFFKEAALTQKIDVGAATPEALAKLGNFVSESISSQSQALGTGAPSQALNF